MSLSVSMPFISKARRKEEPDVAKISVAVGTLFSSKKEMAIKSDVIIALFDDGFLSTKCRLILKDHGNYVGTYTGKAYGVWQKNRACWALARALDKSGIVVNGTPELRDRRSGLVTMRSTIKAVLKAMRYDGEFTSAVIY